MYTKEKIGIELKERINQKLGFAAISKWALNVYLTDVAVNDPELDVILSSLMMMDQGPEFELSHKKLTKIANTLIVGDSSIYTQQEFGQELKERIKRKEDVGDIGNWSYFMYSQYHKDMDRAFRDLLITLGGMGMGPEFERSYEELDKIADKLIAGENVQL